MKKIVSILLLLVLAASLCSCGPKEQGSDIENIQKAGVIRVGMECDYAPFNWMVTSPTETSLKIAGGGYADGYDVYFSKMIGDALGVEVEIVKLEWTGLTLALESGAIDLIIAGMSPTEERKLTVDFTDPYYVGEKCVVVRKDSPFVNALSINDFAGATITCQLNNAFGDLIDQMNGVKKVLKYDSTPRMVEALKAGEVDGFVDEISVGESVVFANPTLTYVSFAAGKGFSVDESDAVNAVGCRKGSDLVAFINELLKNISEEQRLDLMTKAVMNQPLSNMD